MTATHLCATSAAGLTFTTTNVQLHTGGTGVFFLDLANVSVKPLLLPGILLLEVDGVGAGGGVLDSLEIVQRHAELAQHRVAQLLKLACDAC
jgi:hypothetical protein